MKVNWKRGLFRCCVIAWIFWLVRIAWQSEIMAPNHLISGLLIILIGGLVLPALFLLGLRWVIDGFRATEPA